MSDFIVTYTGRMVDPLNMKPEDVDLEDVAHALSHLCRFTGHTKYAYSVADHGEGDLYTQYIADANTFVPPITPLDSRTAKLPFLSTFQYLTGPWAGVPQVLPRRYEA